MKQDFKAATELRTVSTLRQNSISSSKNCSSNILRFGQFSIFTPKMMIWKISNFDKKWCSAAVWKGDSLSKAKQTLAIDDLRLLFFFWITRAVLLQLPNLTLLFQIPIGRKMIQITTKGFKQKKIIPKSNFEVKSSLMVKNNVWTVLYQNFTVSENVL